MKSLRRGAGLVLLGALVSMLAVGGAMAAPPSGKLGQAARAAEAKDAPEPKLQASLAEVAEVAEKRGNRAGATEARTNGIAVSGDRVRVVLEGIGDAALVDSIVALSGGAVQGRYENLVDAFVPPTALKPLARVAVVQRVRQPFRPHADAVAGQGPLATGASIYHTGGFTGTGAKVAIVDLGFGGLADRQAAGDLPAGVTSQNFGCANVNAEDHGTAVAEIVHEMAPSAQLFLLCIGSEVGLGQAKDYALANGITVISHSVGWFNTGRGDGTGGPGTPTGIATSAKAGGILWVNSAGNYARRHWRGNHNRPGEFLYHQFAPGNFGNGVVIAGGGQACVSLKWDDWPASSNDFDVYLIDDTGNDVAWSEGVQSGTQPPTEDFCYTNPGLTSATYWVAISRYDAPQSPRMDLFVTGGSNIQYPVASGSLNEPSTSPATLAAAAICWQNNALETYSSQGPTIDNRIKPDIAGQDSVSSGTYGAFGTCGASGFTGTSAAAPHVAGAAALLRSLHPAWTPDETSAALQAAAGPLGAAGKDNMFGAGKLTLPVPRITTFTPPAGAVGALVTINGSGFAGADAVRFNDGPDVAPVSVTPTRVTVRVPLHATTGKLKVIAGGLAAATATNFKVLTKVTGYLPALGAKVNQEITVNGGGFAEDMTSVKIGAVTIPAAAVTVDRPDQLRFTIPLNAVTGPLSVITPAGTAAGGTLKVLPTVDTVSSMTGKAGDPVVITGRTLQGARVQIGSAMATATPVAGQPVGTQVRFLVPTTAATGMLRVTTVGGSVDEGVFTVLAKVNTLAPALGAAASLVTINGTGFDPAASLISFDGGTSVSPVMPGSTATALRVVVPNDATDGPVTLTTNGVPALGATPSFNVLPRVASFSPAAERVGQPFSIIGSGFEGVTQVKLGTLVLPHSVVSQNQIDVPAVAGATGKVTINTLTGNTISSGNFGVLPTVHTMTPSGVAGERITLEGVTLQGLAVSVNGLTAATAPVAGAPAGTKVSFVIPTTFAGGEFDVLVRNASASLVDSGHNLTVLPKITTFAPTTGIAGFTPISINGSGLNGVDHVSVDGESTTVVLPGSTKNVVKVIVPPAAAMGLVQVFTAVGASNTSTVEFRPTLSVYDFSPASGPPGTVVTINGVGLNGLTRVEFGSTSAEVLPPTNANPNQLMVTVPADAVTGRITVRKTLGTPVATTPGAPSEDSFTVGAPVRPANTTIVFDQPTAR